MDKDLGDILEILVVLAWLLGGPLFRALQKRFGGRAEGQSTPGLESPDNNSAPQPLPPQVSALPSTVRTMEDFELIENAIESHREAGKTLHHEDYERVKAHLDKMGYEEEVSDPFLPGISSPDLSHVHSDDEVSLTRNELREAFLLREVLGPPRSISPIYLRK